jgi:hypothetical protein
VTRKAKPTNIADITKSKTDCIHLLRPSRLKNRNTYILSKERRDSYVEKFSSEAPLNV